MSKSPTSNHLATATVWLIDSRTVQDEKLLARLSWLGRDEQARYRRFVRPERQRQFLLGRILLRHVLGSLLNVEPSSIELNERVGQAPSLKWDDVIEAAVPFFSLSHSDHWVACATSLDIVLGLDIETMDADRDLLALSEQAFDPDVARTIAALRGEARVHAFYQAWSRKEAAYKLNPDVHVSAVKHVVMLPHPDISIVLCCDKAATVDMRTIDASLLC